MKKRILALVGVVALVGLLMPVMVLSAEDTVTCTVSTYVVSVTVGPGVVAYGQLSLGQTVNTFDLGESQTVSNTGTVWEDFSIKSSDATRAGGTTWELVTTTPPGHNEFKHEFSTTFGPPWTVMPADNSFTSLISDVPPGGEAVHLDLRISMPGTTDDYEEHSITVTVMAVEG